MTTSDDKSGATGDSNQEDPMSNREFSTAAYQAEDDQILAEWNLDGTTIRFFEPKTAQLAVISTIRANINDADMETVRIFMQFVTGMADDETRMYLNDRLIDPRDPFDLEGEGGLLAIFDALMEELSGKASKEPSDYQPSRKRTGASSTGNSRAKASTSSRSRSRASSTSSKAGS